MPPVFIVVCNNTPTSKLIYDFIAGFEPPADKDGNSEGTHVSRFHLFSNYDDNGNRLGRPRTILVDSNQLESGEALEKNSREMAATEIEPFRHEKIQREGAAAAEKNITGQELLREVMNVVPYDSEWEAEFARVAEKHPAVLAYRQRPGISIHHHHGLRR